MISIRSTALFAVVALGVAAPSASALPTPKHVPAPHVCADGSAPVRGGVGEDAHTHQTGQGHTTHGNGFGYGHGCGETDGGGGDNGGGGGIGDV